jgi:hypothetical protein
MMAYMMAYGGPAKKLEKIPPVGEPSETDRVIMTSLDLTREELRMIVRQGSLKRMKKGKSYHFDKLGSADYDLSPSASMDRVETITYVDCERIANEYHNATFYDRKLLAGEFITKKVDTPEKKYPEMKSKITKYQK